MERIIRAYRRRGAAGFAGLVMHNVRYYTRRLWRPLASAEDVDFDRRYGTATAGVHEIGSLAIDSPNVIYAVRSETTSSDVFRGVLAQIPEDLSSFSFLDYGCGKGKLLLLASFYGFRKIIGVEFAEELARAAQQNARVFHDSQQRCSDITVWHVDAAEFEPPPGPLVCYMYNPFHLPVMLRVAERLKTSISAHPRPIYVIYVQPTHAAAWESDAWEALVTGHDYTIYRGRLFNSHR